LGWSQGGLVGDRKCFPASQLGLALEVLPPQKYQAFRIIKPQHMDPDLLVNLLGRSLNLIFPKVPSIFFSVSTLTHQFK
jgi:hypothetical protein